MNDTNVIRELWFSTFGVQFLITMIIGAIPYAGSICEDLEYGYIRQLLLRGNLRGYCISKMITVFLSAVMSFTLGIVLFALGVKRKNPWYDSTDSVCMSAVRSGSFRECVKNEQYFFYVVLFAIQLGLLIGLLAMISAYISLFVSNKLLVLSIPIMAYYFSTQYIMVFFPDSQYLNVNVIYTGTSNIFDNDILSFFYAILITIVIGAILTGMTYCRLKKVLNGVKYE